MPVIMGTAGHIDHGKTTLVKALSGIDCDRLVEEKKRGITIELGFAFIDLPSGERLGIVDVPGHEKFVKNMVAGAAGIDFVMLVIAADEGVMPQTREHLEICSLLGIRSGLVALTKVDMVDAELLELVQEDVAEFIQGTFLENSPALLVSAHTGDGVAELAATIDAAAGAFAPKSRNDLFRLAVDRVFTMRGHGTVVTGALASGEVSVGEELVIYPRGVKTKARGLQSHGDKVETAPPGRRTAINLQGLEVNDIERGDVVARPDTLFPSTAWDIELTCLSSSPRALKHRSEIHLHHGSRETMARLFFPEADKLAPGETAVCQALFKTPMAGVYDDRLVIRAFSPLRTVAGGRLINPLGRKVKRFSNDVETLRALAGAEPADVLALRLEMAGKSGLRFAELRILADLDAKTLDKTLQDMLARQKAFLIDKEERRYVSRTAVDELTKSAIGFMRRFHEREPMKIGASRGALSPAFGEGASPRLAHFLIERMLKQGELEAEQEMLRLPGHAVSLASDQAKLREEALAAYREGGVAPPNYKDVLKRLGVTDKQAQSVFTLLREQGELVKVADGLYFAPAALEEIRGKVRDFLLANEEMSAGDFKTVTGLSRKYAIPLMEHMDKEKFTVRVGDKRRLRKREE